jgi:hypothetical protein
LLIPPQFTNPVWEFQTIGQLIERAWAPILAYALLFIPFEHDRWVRNPWFGRIARFLSHLALVWVIFYLLMVPLLISDGVRLYERNRVQVNQQIQEQETRLETIQQQVEQLNDRNLEEIIKQNSSEEVSLESIDAEKVRQQILDQTQQQFTLGQKQAQANLNSQQKSLLKSLVKWGLGAIVSAAIMFTVWRLTREFLLLILPSYPEAPLLSESLLTTPLISPSLAIDLVITNVQYKFPNLTREEIIQMLEIATEAKEIGLNQRQISRFIRKQSSRFTRRSIYRKGRRRRDDR